MELSDMLNVALKVIADWRVVAISIAMLVVFALLRYVGLVYHKRPKVRARPSIGASEKAAGQTPSDGGSGSEELE
jgi:hypothetical protein